MLNLLVNFAFFKAICLHPTRALPACSLPGGAAGDTGEPWTGPLVSRKAPGPATPRSPGRGREIWPLRPVTIATVSKKSSLFLDISKCSLVFLFHFVPSRVGPCLLLLQEAQGEEAVKSREGQNLLHSLNNFCVIPPFLSFAFGLPGYFLVLEFVHCLQTWKIASSPTWKI